MNKRYNIGITTKAGNNGGFIVDAANADEAYKLVVKWCGDIDLPLQPGHMSQLRGDHTENNAYFDRNYPLVMVL